jgi:predicted DNA-binding transcriptional regulator AlpA
MTNYKIISSYEVLELTGLGDHTLEAMRNDGRFAPLPLECSSQRCYRYREQEVKDWVAAGCPHRTKWNWKGN